MNQEKIGKFILENRKKKNLTQNDLAKRLKVSNYTISNWENGKSMPSYELLIPLTKELDISISELINGEYESEKEEPNKVSRVYDVFHMSRPEMDQFDLIIPDPESPIRAFSFADLAHLASMF